MRTTDERLAIGRPEVLLPRKGLDLTKWAVIACDQYTSEPEYWRKVEAFVGDAPSALNLIYPEAYLGEADPDARIARIREHMNLYLERRLFEKFEGFVYVERRTGTGLRKGLLLCLDLEHYDFRRGATSLIRATEGTILSRIPPRVRIRQVAPLELPHIMVLIDDPGNDVMGAVEARKPALRKLYDFDLMMDSGHLAGYGIEEGALEKAVLGGLRTLVDPRIFAMKYGLRPETPVLLYAMGDGNHSLATAKAIWESLKESGGDVCTAQAPRLRYALVEVVNLHDPALVFEPIHRVAFDLAPGRNIVEEFISRFSGGRGRYIDCETADRMTALVDERPAGRHRIGLVLPEATGFFEVDRPKSNLEVGTLQTFLDDLLEKKGAREVDYVHGTETVLRLGRRPGGAGFYLPAMDKRQLFKTVILDGALPRKTFSMGEAWEKRFYVEARRLTEP